MNIKQICKKEEYDLILSHQGNKDENKDFEKMLRDMIMKKEMLNYSYTCDKCGKEIKLNTTYYWNDSAVTGNIDDDKRYCKDCFDDRNKRLATK